MVHSAHAGSTEIMVAANAAAAFSSLTRIVCVAMCPALFKMKIIVSTHN